MDAAFVGGPVATMDAARSVSDAVAVRDGRIAAVGATAVRALRPPPADVIDLRGRLLLPGFHDAHVHPVFGGIQRSRCDLSGGTDAADCLARIAAHLRARPGTGWLLGGGWEMGWFPGGTPTRRALDSVTGDRPAYLLSADLHSAWVNSAALRLAGIGRDTPDPADGRIERDAAGWPGGTLHEGAARSLRNVLPPASQDEYRAGLLAGQRHLHSLGVTSWHDAIIGPYLGYADLLGTYRDADERGLLTGKVHGALWWDRQRGTEQIDELRARRAAAGGRRFRAETVKIMLDGVCENFTAAMLMPYLGHHGSGLTFVAPEMLSKAVPELTAAGFGLHFHAVGDRAVRSALDSLRDASPARRHQIAHLQVVQSSDLARFHELGVAATIQPRWAVNDAAMTELTVPWLGRRRAASQYPFRALHAAGAMLAAGSDWPVSTADPMRAVHVAVNRTDPDTPDAEPFLPEQALDLADALAAYTIGGAWVNHAERDTGSIEPGKAADLVVLDRDPFSLPTTEIGQTGVLLTMIDGVVVHDGGM